MKHSELIKVLTEAGCYCTRNGKRHDIYYSPITGNKEAVPRHGSHEVGKGLADKIIKRLLGE